MKVGVEGANGVMGVTIERETASCLETSTRRPPGWNMALKGVKQADKQK
jgi:hypothetical protein